MNLECAFIEVEHYCEIKRNHFKIPEIKRKGIIQQIKIEMCFEGFFQNQSIIINSASKFVGSRKCAIKPLLSFLILVMEWNLCMQLQPHHFRLLTTTTTIHLHQN